MVGKRPVHFHKTRPQPLPSGSSDASGVHPAIALLTCQNRGVTTTSADAATRTDRDLFADFLRTVALGAVVFGHWIMAAIWIDHDGLHADNVLNQAPYLWPLTWVLLLVPLFFLVGGFVNAHSLARVEAAGGSYGTFLRRRLGGLLPPIVPFLIVVATGVGLALALGAPRSLTRGVAVLVVMPLWFLAVYAVLALVTKPMLALHRRFGWGVCVVMALVACGFDALRFATEQAWVAFPNYFLVWGLAQQLGFAYCDGRLLRLRHSILALWTALAFGLLALAVMVGPWPPSMVGLSGERSNFAPPAVPALLLMLAQVPLVLLLRGRVNRWLARPKPARMLSIASAVAMPAFLWHLPVLVAVTGLALLARVPFPLPGSVVWWASRPLWLAVLAGALAGFLWVLARLRS